MTDYVINIRSIKDGRLLVTIPQDGLLACYYERKVNELGTFEATLNSQRYPGIRELVNLRGNIFPYGITLDSVVEIWRRPTLRSGLPGIWRMDAQFLLRYVRDQMLENGLERFTIIGRDIKHVLGRAAIFPKGATPPEGQETGDFTAVFPWPLPDEATFKGMPHVADDDSTAEKMYGMFLRAQAVNQIALDPTYFTNATIDPGGIPVHVIGERYSNLLDALQNASGASWFASYYALESTPANEGCDFDLIPTVTVAPFWPWEFRVFVGGRGNDRTKANSEWPVIFTFTQGVRLPTYIHDMLTQKTRAIVGGQGDDVNRDVLLLTNPTTIAYSPLNKNDAYIDARQAEPLALPDVGFGQLVKDGLYLLKEEGEQEEFTFEVSRNLIYGVDFDLGDLVTVETPYLERDYQVRGVHVRMNENGTEDVAVEFGLLDGTSVRGRDLLEQMLQLIRDNEKKMEETQAAE